MLRNYITIALRNFKRLKIYSVINITGLAIGIACALLIFLFALDENGYDECYNNADNIYRVYVKSCINGETTINSKSACPTAQTMLQRFPEVMKAARIGYFGQYNFRYGGRYFREGAVYTADSNFFEIFNIPFVKGNPKTALSRPNSLVLTENAAQKYFGSADPVGKLIEVDGGKPFLVTGLIRDFPRKAHFACNFLLSMCTYAESESQFWLELHYTTYILLRDGTSPASLERKMTVMVSECIGPQAEKILGIRMEQFLRGGNTYNLLLQPIKSIYLKSKREYGIDPNTEWGNVRSSDIAYIYIFIGIGIFILLIAVINFINLATSRSERRAREVGIRKTMGAARMQLIWQFLIESILTCAAAVLLGVILLQLMLPSFNALAGKDIRFNLFANYYILPCLVLFIVAIGIIAGSYPAFYLSRFNPVEVLKSNAGKSGRKSVLRSSMVTFQFTISIVLMICTIVVKSQLSYMQNKNLGFNKDCLIAIQNGAALGDKLETFKKILASNANISSVTASSRMFLPGIAGNAYMYNNRTGTNLTSALYLLVDPQFQKTFQLKVKSGRFFSDDFVSDSGCVVVNESMARECGVTDPVGGELTRFGGATYRIIGVVKDFNCESLHQSVRPLVFHLSPVTQAAKVITIRVNMAGVKDALSFVNVEWEKFVKCEKCYYQFMDEHLASLYENEERTGIIATIFTVLAIVIACLGLFGLSAFIAEQKVKEIGIRKVHGASVSSLIIMLSKEFTKWVLVANILAWPAAYLLMRGWLEDFPYRINLEWYIFAVAGAGALVIALITVSSQTIKAALTNPVRSLRYE